MRSAVVHLWRQRTYKFCKNLGTSWRTELRFFFSEDNGSWNTLCGWLVGRLITMSVSQQLVKSQNSLMEKLHEATMEIGCVSLKLIGSRLLFWQSWTFGKYTRQATPITEPVDYVEFPEETKYQTLFHDWYLSLLWSFQFQTWKSQAMPCERSINSDGNYFVLFKRMTTDVSFLKHGF